MLNQIGEQGRLPKLSEVLFERSSRSFGSLAAFPSNIEAIEAALLFAAGMNKQVAILGPSGWGKTHLLDAVSSRLCHELGTPVERLGIGDVVSNPTRIESTNPLILDDVQEIIGKARPQLSLRFALERRVRSGRPTILAFTMPKFTRELRTLLPNYREWSVACMAEPVAAERVLLLNQMSGAEGLSISPQLVTIIAQSMYGNGRTLAGALKRLRLSSSTWLDDSATIRACGLLDPFFADNPDWDLKLKVLKVAESFREAYPKVCVSDLAITTMLHEACLAEDDVARALGISPTDAYQRAARFNRLCESDPSLKHCVGQFVHQVVESLY